MSCFFCDGPKVAPVYNIPLRDYFAARIGTMTMMRGYDGERRSRSKSIPIQSSVFLTARRFVAA